MRLFLSIICMLFAHLPSSEGLNCVASRYIPPPYKKWDLEDVKIEVGKSCRIYFLDMDYIKGSGCHMGVDAANEDKEGCEENKGAIDCYCRSGHHCMLDYQPNTGGWKLTDKQVNGDKPKEDAAGVAKTLLSIGGILLFHFLLLI